MALYDSMFVWFNDSISGELGRLAYSDDLITSN